MVRHTIAPAWVREPLTIALVLVPVAGVVLLARRVGVDLERSRCRARMSSETGARAMSTRCKVSAGSTRGSRMSRWAKFHLAPRLESPMPNSNNLDIDLVGIEADNAGIQPRISAKLEAENDDRTDFQIHGWNITASLEFNDDESRSLPSSNIETLPPRSFSRSGGADQFKVFINLNRYQLEKIEEYRHSEDMSLLIDLSVGGVGSDDDGYSYQERLSQEIPSAIWREMLSEFNFHNKRRFELDLGVSTAQVRDSLSTAEARINRAQERHDAGDYPSAIRLCRDAIESLEHVDHEIETLVDNQKWNDFESHLGQIKKGFIGTLSHSEDMTGSRPSLKRDSDFVIGITKSFLRYIATVAEEEG